MKSPKIADDSNCQSNFCSEIDTVGYSIATEMVTGGQIAAIVTELADLSDKQSLRRGAMYAARNLLLLSSIKTLVASHQIRILAGGLEWPRWT